MMSGDHPEVGPSIKRPIMVLVSYSLFKETTHYLEAVALEAQAPHASSGGSAAEQGRRWPFSG